MTISTNSSFAQINENNQTVDRSIENLVQIACSLDEETPRRDRLELEKTTRLLFLSSLVMGERDNGESDDEDFDSDIVDSDIEEIEFEQYDEWKP